MKILKIDCHKAKYSLDGENYNPIVNISKEDLKKIVDYIMENDDIELDCYDEAENKIDNKAESIIYSDLYIKLYDLTQKKKEILEKVNSKFSNLIEKYELD